LRKNLEKKLEGHFREELLPCIFELAEIKGNVLRKQNKKVGSRSL
jgi:hypothetical protein